MKCSNELGEEEEEEEEMKIDDGEKSESAKECTERAREKKVMNNLRRKEGGKKWHLEETREKE